MTAKPIPDVIRVRLSGSPHESRRHFLRQGLAAGTARIAPGRYKYSVPGSYVRTVGKSGVASSLTCPPKRVNRLLMGSNFRRVSATELQS